MNKSLIYKDHSNLCTKINEVCFLWIPKNCSSSFRTFPSISFTRAESDDKVVVILRDPYTRYLSAVPTLVERQNDVSKTELTYLDFFGIDKDLIFDEHTTPQVDYLKKINLNNVDFYLYSKTVLEEINKKYKLWSDRIPHENDTQSNVNRLKIKKDLEKAIAVNPNLFYKIRNTYADDYKLLDRYIPTWRKQ